MKSALKDLMFVFINLFQNFLVVFFLSRTAASAFNFDVARVIYVLVSAAQWYGNFINI